jgi:eukaryotic-like serine/threonine-protein kinase
MNIRQFFKSETIGDFLRQLGTGLGILLLIVVVYFYIYLPNATNHGDSLTVPDLTGLPSDKLDSFLSANDLRFEISDSTFSDGFKPLEVIRQFPHAGSIVKPGRKIYVSINRMNPPTVPLPALVEQSLINARAILKSNELKPGKVYYSPSPFSELVLEMQVSGVKMEGGERIAKGTVVDLIVGDGAGPNHLRVRNFVGIDLKSALLMLSGYNLHRGDITIPADVDTTDIISYVLKQFPEPGDSVKVGDPVDFWIGPKDYVLVDSLVIMDDDGDQ